MSGRVGNLTDKEAEKLEKFRESVKDVHQDSHDDILLLRFLRARKFDLIKAEDMFRKDLEWKEKNLTNKEYVVPEVIEKHFGGGFIGFDSDGAPIYIDPFGSRDVKGLMKSTKSSELQMFWTHLCEKFLVAAQDQNKKLGKDVGGVVTIYDMEGFGKDFFWKPWLNLNNKLAALMEAHYPENAKTMYVVNVPKIFLVLWAIMKKLLHEDTTKKVFFLGSDWKTQLVKVVDADILPVHYGGNRVDPDGNPRCPSVVPLSVPVPQSYYIQGKDLSGESLQTREVKAASTLEFKYEVAKPGSILSYEFRTKKGDIGFSVKKINPDGSKVDIVGKERYNCHVSPEEDSVTLEDPGVYMVKFDNTYSYTRGKSLSYFVELLEPVDEPEVDLAALTITS